MYFFISVTKPLRALSGGIAAGECIKQNKFYALLLTL